MALVSPQALPGRGPQEVTPLAPGREDTEARSPGGRLGPAAVGSATRVPLGTHPAPGAGGAVSPRPLGILPLTSRRRPRERVPVPAATGSAASAGPSHRAQCAGAARGGGSPAAGTATPRDFGERRRELESGG